MKRWLNAEVLGGVLTSLALAMLALGIALAKPSVVFADDGSGSAGPPTANPCEDCSFTICKKNVPGSCGDATNGIPCPFDGGDCPCNCITVSGACTCAQS